jgi:hypothetical protein
MIKFRTMKDAPVDTGPRITAHDDARVTRLGHVLRHTKLNELPQLINVIKGEMSLVGPRPEDPQYVALYTPEQRRVLSVTPGITSIASILYRDEESMLDQDTLQDTYVNVIMPDKLSLDLEYLDHRSFLVDLDLFWKTVLVLLPRFVRASPELEELLYGPVQRFIRRRLSWFTLDLILSLLAVSMVNLIWRRVGAPIATVWPRQAALAAGVALMFTLVNQIYGLQHSLWSSASGQEAIDILLAALLSTLLLLAVAGLGLGVSLEWIILAGFFAAVLFTAARYRKRLIRGGLSRCRSLWQKQTGEGRKKVLIVGTDRVGCLCAWELAGPRWRDHYRLVGFVDDDLTKRGMCISGWEVLGSCRVIPTLVAKHDVDLIIVAANESEARRRQAIVEICRSTGVRTQVIPDILQFINESGELSQEPTEGVAAEVQQPEPRTSALHACSSEQTVRDPDSCEQILV